MNFKNCCLFLLPFFFFACGETNNSDTSTNDSTSTETNQGITFQLDDEDWIAPVATGGLIEEKSGRKIISVSGIGGFEGVPPGMFAIKIFGFNGTGTYETGVKEVKMMISLQISKGEKSGSYVGGRAGDQVNITDYDPATQTISGNFAFQLKGNPINFTGNTPPEFVTITNGIFKNVKMEVMNM